MHAPLSLYNCSLKKTLGQLDDPIMKARITVFYFIFIMNFLKIPAVLTVYIMKDQTDQIINSLIASVVTLVILKLLLSRPQYFSFLVHFALLVSVCGIWNELFLFRNNLNIIILQNVFMICMWSFYGLKGYWGLIYSSAAGLPLIGYVLLHQTTILVVGNSILPIGVLLMIIIVNFIIIFFGHYYYRDILFKTMTNGERLNEELEKSNTAKILFFSSISHELRNPLNTVIGMTTLLKEKNNDIKQAENIDILQFSAESLRSIINDILDFNKLGSGKLELESIPFNLRALLENSCAGLKIEAMEKGLFFRINIAKEFGNPYLLGDPTRLMQIIYNLVGNAIKFTDQGGIEIKVNVLWHLDQRLLLRFVVQDTGVGIGKENQKHIFDPFTQESNTTTREFGGTGLGLGIVKQLLKLHDSTIHLESERNVGTKFYFDINYSETMYVPEPQEEVVKVRGKDQLSGMKVLLAEDNPMNILFMKKLFDNWGIGLHVVEDGAEAFRMVSENDYDVILMDIHMPILNGYEAAKKIREREGNAKKNYIIALTGTVSEEARTLVEQSGMDDMISKPFQPDELYRKLEDIWHADSVYLS